MAMNCTQLKGVIVDRGKNKIIKRYKNGILINTIARDYNVEIDTICRRLKKWGVKLRKGDFKRKPKFVKHFKRVFSPGLKARMAENTRINNIHIRHCEFVHITEDQKLISNILCRPIIG